MKDQYFFQHHPDEDDALLKHFIAQKVVPIGCLLGGALIEVAVQAKLDPCGDCPGPRHRCRGRKQRKGLELVQVDSTKIYGDSRETLKVKQLQRASELTKLLEEAFG